MSTTLPLSFNALVQNPWIQTTLVTPLFLIFLDVITGVMSAVKNGTFNMKYLADFMGKNGDLTKYLGGFALVFAVYLFRGSSEATTVASMIGMSPLAASTLKSILENISELKPADDAPTSVQPQDVSQVQTRQMPTANVPQLPFPNSVL